MELKRKTRQWSRREGQTAVEYMLLMGMVTLIIILTLEQMQKPVKELLETLSQGFQSVVRYGDRSIRADNVFEKEHPGNPSNVIPRHF